MKDTQDFKVVKGTLFTLDWRDAGKGAVMAFLTASLTAFYNVLNGGVFNFNWVTFKPILTAGVVGLIAYFLKNLGTDKKIVKADGSTTD